MLRGDVAHDGQADAAARGASSPRDPRENGRQIGSRSASGTPGALVADGDADPSAPSPTVTRTVWPAGPYLTALSSRLSSDVLQRVGRELHRRRVTRLRAKISARRAAASGRNSSTMRVTSSATFDLASSAAPPLGRCARSAARSRRGVRGASSRARCVRATSRAARRSSAAEPQRLEVEADLRQRRAQLVRDAGDEVRAHAASSLSRRICITATTDIAGGEEQQAEQKGKAGAGKSADDEAAALSRSHRDLERERRRIDRGGPVD